MGMRLEQINYIYSPDNAFRKHALKDINLEIKDGEFIGLIGHTGSGKSTLIQHLNGILKASSGKIYFNDQDVYEAELKFWKEIGRDSSVAMHEVNKMFIDACLEKLNGIYAFAVWEVKAKRLFLASDRMGVKPLFYALQNQ